VRPDLRASGRPVRRSGGGASAISSPESRPGSPLPAANIFMMLPAAHPPGGSGETGGESQRVPKSQTTSAKSIRPFAL
jgi:hypothetical protein